MRLGRTCSLALCAAVLAIGAAQARSVTVRGTDMAGFGRILLEFDQPTKVKVQSSGGLIVLSFPEPTKIAREKLALELPNYLGVVRQDPDGLGLRSGRSAAGSPRNRAPFSAHRRAC